MAKRILSMFVLLALVAGLYAMTATAKGEGKKVDPTRTAQASQTVTSTPGTCKVNTGVDSGIVNLRACPGTSCDVLGILSNGDLLTVIKGGAWLKVRTVNNQIGYVKSKYCKKEK